MEFLLCVLGVVMITEGVLYFALPERMKEMMRAVIKMHEYTLRKIGFALMAAGLVVVYIARL
jgi:uncharacterized protein